MDTLPSEKLFSSAKQSPTRNWNLPAGNERGPIVQLMDLEKVAQGVRLILEGIGEDPNREGLVDTPARVARLYEELCYGIDLDAASEVTCDFHVDDNDLVLVKDINFASLCEHHLVPFIGSAHIAYIPQGGKITGLSKLARVVELTSKRPQVQERMTAEIADAINSALKPSGVLVVLQAEHLCMSIRGIKKPGAKTITTAARGILSVDNQAKAEVMQLILRS